MPSKGITTKGLGGIVEKFAGFYSFGYLFSESETCFLKIQVQDLTYSPRISNAKAGPCIVPERCRGSDNEPRVFDSVFGFVFRAV